MIEPIRKSSRDCFPVLEIEDVRRSPFGMGNLATNFHIGNREYFMERPSNQRGNQLDFYFHLVCSFKNNDTKTPKNVNPAISKHHVSPLASVSKQKPTRTIAKSAEAVERIRPVLVTFLSVNPPLEDRSNEMKTNARVKSKNPRWYSPNMAEAQAKKVAAATDREVSIFINEST